MASLSGNSELKKGWVVYILKCSDGSYYTGITNDPDRRLQAHNAGTASKYTRSRLPVRLVYREGQANKSRALRREMGIKRLSRAQKISLIKTPQQK